MFKNTMFYKDKFFKIVQSLKYHIKYTFFYDTHEKKYIEYNFKKWSEYNVEDKDSNGIILLDLFDKKCLIHFWSYIVNYLGKKKKFKIKYFYIGLYNSRISRYKFSIRKLIKIYKSFNVSKGISEFDFNFSKKELKNIEQKFYQLEFDKKKLKKFKIDNILLGDLIYDTYLRSSYIPSVDMRDEYLKQVFFKTVKLYYHTKKFFNHNKVKAVVPSHVCYYYGVISRIAANRNIPIIKVNSENRGNENFRINFVDKKYVNEEAAPYFHFKKIFKKLSKEDQKLGIIKGKETLENRLSGNYDSSLSYMKTSQFNKKLKNTNLIKNNKKKKIFIFPHCYFDNVHRFRYFLFDDFMDQINYILNLTKKFNQYDWYYKPHTHELKNEIEIHKQMLKKYPNVTLLKPTVSHNQIIKTKPYCVITNHGTVGHEYAAFKIPVIFTGDNKHINYNFGLHIKSKKQIDNAIDNKKLFQKKISFKKSDLYEFIFMNYIYFQNLYDKKNLIKDSYFNIKNKKLRDKSNIYSYLIKNSKTNDKKIFKYLENAFSSRDIKI